MRSDTRPAHFQRLSSALTRVHPGLQFEMGGEEDGTRELVIGTDGNPSAFPAVRTLVEAAPPLLPGWKVTAFRQRIDLTTRTLKFEDATYTPQQLWYVLRSEGDKIGLDLYLGEFDDPTSRIARMVVLLFLEKALGELDVETKLGKVRVYSLPTDAEARGLQPFLTLPEQFDALYTLMHGIR